MAKNKVKFEYDVDMEKERRKKQQKNGKPGFAIRRSNILLYGLLLVVEVLFYYFLTPAINVHTSGYLRLRQSDSAPLISKVHALLKKAISKKPLVRQRW